MARRVGSAQNAARAPARASPARSAAVSPNAADQVQVQFDLGQRGDELGDVHWAMRRWGIRHWGIGHCARMAQ